MSQPIHAFKIALGFTLKWEGNTGLPDALEQPTQKGITQTTYDTYRRHKGLAFQPVYKISLAEIEQVYRELFWKPSQADLMSLPLAVVHFDTAVNFGVLQSIKLLQTALGNLGVDGIIGPKTIAALTQANHLEIAHHYCQHRQHWRYRQVQKHSSQPIFLAQGLSRDKDLQNFMTQLAPDSAMVDYSIMPVYSEKQRKAIAKLEQAINLLQEAVETLKQPE